MRSEALKNNIKKQEILGALEEGVLCINEEFEITEEYSSSLEKIIDQEIKSGQSFVSLFTNRVPENIVNNTVEYLHLMFKDDLDEETVNELNPLNVVEFHFENRWGLWTSSKYLRFRFNRLLRDKKITGLITTVTDITKQISLSKKLEEVEKETNKQMEWLVNMLHVEPPLLKEFLDVFSMFLCGSKRIKRSKPDLRLIIGESHIIFIHKTTWINTRFRRNIRFLMLKGNTVEVLNRTLIELQNNSRILPKRDDESKMSADG